MLNLLLLLLAACTLALHIEQLDTPLSHNTLYQLAENDANRLNDSVILISFPKSRVGVGFPRCRMASVFRAKSDVNRLLASEDEAYYSLLERVNTLLVPRLHKMRSAHCLLTEPLQSSESNTTTHTTRFSVLTEHPVEAGFSLVLTVMIIILVAVCGGKCIGDLTRDPVTGRHSAAQVPHTLLRVFRELKDAALSGNWRGEKID